MNTQGYAVNDLEFQAKGAGWQQWESVRSSEKRLLGEKKKSLLKKEAPGCRGRLIQQLSQMAGEDTGRQKRENSAYSNPTQVVAGREKAH